MSKKSSNGDTYTPSIRNQYGWFVKKDAPKDWEEVRVYTAKDKHSVLKQAGVSLSKKQNAQLDSLLNKSGRTVKTRTEEQKQKKIEEDIRFRQGKYEQGKKLFNQPEKGKLSHEGDVTTRIIGGSDAEENAKKVAEEAAKYEQGEHKRQQVDTYNPKLEREAYGIRQRDTAKLGHESEFPKFNETDQLKIIEIYNKANERLKEIKEQFGSELGYGFHLRPSDDIETIIKKLQKAYDVLSDDYVERTMAQLKLDFIGNFSNHIDQDYSQKLIEAIANMDADDFFAILEKTGRSYLAYSLDSMIKYDDYENIAREVDIIVQEAKKMKALHNKPEPQEQEELDKIAKKLANSKKE